MTKYLTLTLALIFSLTASSCKKETQSGAANRATASSITNSATGDRFEMASECAQCHDGIADSSGNDVSIVSSWSGGMMANAAYDPLWQAKVESEGVRHAKLKDRLEPICARCHMPMAVYEAKATDQDFLLTGTGLLNSENALHELGMEGVSCTFCHQIQPQGLGTEATFSGQPLLDYNIAKPNRKLFGPYETPYTMPMEKNVGFTPAYGAHISESGLCATCHTLFTTVLDANGEFTTDSFPEQTPFLEWQASSFGSGATSDDQTCQDCHMKLAAGAVKVSLKPGHLAKRDTFKQHQFLGANAWMVGILKANRADLVVTASDAAFDATIKANQNYLANDAATVTIQSSEITGGKLVVVLKITNLTGHKFPTGYPSRRAWLHVTAKDAATTFFESGSYGASGKITGNDADEEAALVEAHQTKITSSTQVQIYEAIAKDSSGAVTYSLLSAATHAKDNRLLPAGFEKSTVSSAIAVHGAASSDSNFVGGSDLVTYEIDLGGRANGFTFQAELLYQAASYRFLQDLYQDETASTRVAKFKKMADTAGGGVEKVAAATKSF